MFHLVCSVFNFILFTIIEGKKEINNDGTKWSNSQNIDTIWLSFYIVSFICSLFYLNHSISLQFFVYVKKNSMQNNIFILLSFVVAKLN